MMPGRYYLINSSGVYSGRNRTQLDKKLEISTEETDYKSFGSDKVLNVTQEDMTFLKDKKRLSLIPMERLFKKDNSTKLLLIITAALSFLNLLQK